MGLFSKKQEQKKPLDKLPELPRLPELPGFENEKPHQLPRYPNDSLGDKFSQNTIKEAITGKKEVKEFDADEFATEDEMQMMLELPKHRVELPSEIGIEKKLEKAFSPRVKEVEPVFIRIDKFEEALHNFEKTRKQIMEIEKMLREIKSLKEQEERELQSWEKEVQSVKQQIAKIDADIFSKLE